MKKILLILLIIIIIIPLAGYIYIITAYPKVSPAKDIQIKSTPELIARGNYLANHVAVCMDCHSVRDWSKFSGPLKENTLGKGGEKFSHEYGFPGTFYSKNITPYNLKSWTDGEIYRLITTGVKKDGNPIFPVMPYPAYNKMTPDDVKAIIAYIRTLKPIKSDVPDSKADFPMNIIMRFIPKDSQLIKKPSPSDKITYGKYLVNISACTECHTQQIKGKPKPGYFLAGGFEFKMPGFISTSANITPDKETGIGNWSREDFVKRFKQFDPANYTPHKVNKGQFNTAMPWYMYAGMTEEDLSAIYEYLKTVKPVKNKVQTFKAN